MDNIATRDLRPSDFDDLHALVSTWKVVRQLGSWPWPADPDWTRARVEPYRGDGFVEAITDNDRLIGTIGVTGGDMGYMIAPSHWGRGIASRIAADAVARAFATTSRGHLTGSVWSDNHGSAAVLRKLGFVHWQTRYLRSKARRLPTLVYHMVLTRADWDRLSAGGDWVNANPATVGSVS